MTSRRGKKFDDDEEIVALNEGIDTGLDYWKTDDELDEESDHHTTSPKSKQGKQSSRPDSPLKVKPQATSDKFPDGVCQRWTEFTSRNRRAIIAFWLLIACPMGLYSTPKLMARTTMDFSPPEGSPSHIAAQKFRESFQVAEWDKERPVVIILEQELEDGESPDHTLIDGTSATYKSARDFVLKLETILDEFIEDAKPHDEDRDGPPSVSFLMESYYGFMRDGFEILAKHTTVNKSARSTVVGVKWSLPPEYKKSFLKTITTYCDTHAPEGVKVYYTGLDFVNGELIGGIIEDMDFMDKFVGPMAMLILAVFLGNIPLMIVPILAVVTSVLSSMTLFYPVSLVMKVTQIGPGLAVSVIFALSIDYSLFLLSRCAEDMARGMSKKEAIQSMVEHSGHTITVSAITLSGCAVPLCILPVEMIQTLGVGGVIAIMTTVFVNISLTPALLATSLGDKLLKPNRFLSMLCCNTPGNPSRYRTLLPTKGGIAPKNDLLTETEFKEMKKSVWFKIGKILVNPCKGLPILGLVSTLFILPIARHCPDLVFQSGPKLMLPRGGSAVEALDSIGHHFGYGKVSPYKLIVDGKESGSRVDTKEGFQVMSKLVSSLSAKDMEITPLKSFTGIAAMSGTPIPHSLYDGAMKCGIDCISEFFKAMVWASQNKLVSKDGMTSIIYVVLEVDPFGSEGTEWLQKARQKITELSDNDDLEGYEVFIHGEPAQSRDTVDSIVVRFPMLVGITLVLVFVLMGYFYNSVAIPILSIVSILFTLAFVYGLLVDVYQNGLFDKLNLDSMSSKTGGIYWLPPFLASTFITGLGLDYDIFLISRIQEYRQQGFTHESSILAAMYKTRGIITAAGIIMAVALGGLIHSRAALMNQVAFMLSTSVLLDTFLIRIIVVPVLMGALGKITWWPTKMPKETIDLLEQ